MTRDAGRESSIRYFRAVLITTALMPTALPAAAQSADHAGKAPYDRNCGVCHGPAGRGNVAPPLVPLERTFDEVLAIVREGRGEMPPVSANAVSDDALRLIVDYLQAQRKRAAGGDARRHRVTAHAVSAARTRTEADHKGPPPGTKRGKPRDRESSGSLRADEAVATTARSTRRTPPAAPPAYRPTTRIQESPLP
jgi:mono/diheme cytochrome c family protein